MNAKPREGDIYDVLYIDHHRFTICYGYYDEAERGSSDPIPIFPCFQKDPVYTANGKPLVTRIQDACEHYAPTDGVGDGWCADCIHGVDWKMEIGICNCPQRNEKTDVNGRNII